MNDGLRKEMLEEDAVVARISWWLMEIGYSELDADGIAETIVGLAKEDMKRAAAD